MNMNIALPTLQEVFDKAVTHLLTQRARSENGGECRYRGDGGLMCAVCAFIEDEFYTKTMEGKKATQESVAIGLIKSNVINPGPILSRESREMMDMMMNFQDIHDHHFVYEWSDYLLQHANRFGLDTGVLGKFK